MSMVADHMLRAPAIQYRLQQERQRLAQQDALNQVRAEDYRASARKTNLEGDAQAERNAAMQRIKANEGAVDALIQQWDDSPEKRSAVRAYANDVALAFGKSAADVANGLITMGREYRTQRMSKEGAPARDIGIATGGATSIANADTRAASDLATAGIRAESGADKPPEDEYETVTQVTPGREIPEEAEVIPAVPERGKWNPFVANTPAIPARTIIKRPATIIPEERVTFKRKRGGVADLAGSGVEDFADQTMDEDDSDLGVTDVTDAEAAPEGEGVSGIQNGNAAALASAPSFRGAYKPDAETAAALGGGKVLTPEIAKEYLAKYQNRAKAEAAAKADGFTW